MLPVSNDTLLRAVRRRGSPRFVPPTVVGIDDWAWRRNQRYGTILCDLERRKTIALLPDREPATAQVWLSDQPQIAIVARDRGGSYALAAAKALPNAVQVAGRWHLMENASHAFLDAVRKSMRQVRNAIGAATINPTLLTAAERLQYEGYLHREETNTPLWRWRRPASETKRLSAARDTAAASFVRCCAASDPTSFASGRVRLRYSCNGSMNSGRPDSTTDQSYGGASDSMGSAGPLRVVSEWATRRRKAEKADGSNLSRAPSARTVARLMTFGRDGLTKSESVTVAAIEGEVPLLVEARNIIASFQAMIRKKSLADLEPWLERARSSLVASFANGVIKDRAAVSAAISSPWSNGQTEGQITKLKLVKRQMYGRGKLDLLQARVIGAA